MQGLVTNLIDAPNFWSSLTKPLFTNLLKNVKAYNQLFNILGIELYCSTNKTNNSVKHILNKFLEKEDYFEKWIDYVFDLPKLSKEEYMLGDNHEWLCQLQSFKDFIVILLRKNTKGLEISTKKLKLLAKKTLAILVDRIEHIDDHRPFIILAEMYLIILNSFKHSYVENEEEEQDIIRCVKILLSHSINLFTQHKNLKALISGRRSQYDIRDCANGDLADEIITALNDLTEIIILCSRCLLQFSPQILDLLCEPEFLSTKWEPLLEIQFGLPKLTDDSQLTFGVVLSAIGIFTKALNLQNYGFHEVPLNIFTTSNEGSAEKGKSIVNPSRSHFSKSLSTVSVSSTTAPPNELLSNLDSEMCLFALEHILSLIASQSLLALKNPYIGSREKQLIKREISTELITYHEFIRKKVLVDYRDHKDIWHRKKYGIQQIELQNDNSTFYKENSQRLTKEKTSFKASPANFEMSTVYSPIAGTSKNLIGTSISSTPQVRRVCDESEIDFATKSMAIEDEIEYFPPEEPIFTPLSYIQLIEEDYLHCMSNLYSVICQSD
uniref:Uncharacterized protein n=1 Tax=Megaselia scalaris TaxID=36166 RepID=T1GIK3_MEGSC